MIRFLALVVGLALGLAVAVALNGRVAHLRLAGLAPEWMAGFDAGAGLLAGQSRFADATLRWQAVGVDLEGPRWALVLDGADWQARAEGRADAAGLRLTAITGLVPGAWLHPSGQGILAIRDGAVRIFLPAGVLLDGWLDGQARALVLAPVQVEGEVSLTVSYGEWRRR